MLSLLFNQLFLASAYPTNHLMFYYTLSNYYFYHHNSC